MKIELSNLNEYKKNYKKNKKNDILMSAITNNGLNNVAFNKESIQKSKNIFSINVKTGKVCNQKQSGRCWLFAGLNTLRNKIINDKKLNDFEFSQVYLTFYDKLEKANFFLNQIVKTKDLELTSREVQFLLESAISDGGEWSYFTNLVKKYGVCPKYVMDESIDSEKTLNMNYVLESKLKQDALILRNTTQNTDELINDMLKDIYKILVMCLGKPVEKFNFEYVDKDEKYHIVKNISPLDFYKDFINLNLDDFVNLSNIENDKFSLNNVYISKYINNMIDGNHLMLVNVEINKIKEALIKSLKDNNIVWFACDVLAYSSFPKGILDTNLYNYADLFDIDLTLNKKERASFRLSLCNHAMAFSGVNLINNKANRWKVENSWGEKDTPFNGYFIMSDEYFNEYVYEVIIDKKYLDEETLKLLEKKPIELKPWELI